MNAGYPAELLEFVFELRSQGIVLYAEEGEIVCRGPREALTSSRLDTLRLRKRELLQLLEEEERALRQEIPELSPDVQNRFMPFPLTDNQQAYWIGRGDTLQYGQVGIHAYFELEVPGLDVERLEKCLNTLVQRHDMLHAVVVGDGMQRILREYSPIRIMRTDASDLSAQEADKTLDSIRRDLSCRCYSLETWPQCAFHAVRLPDGTDILFASQDTWCLDGQSYRVLMEELAALYHGLTLPPPPGLSFRDYVLAMRSFRNSFAYQASLSYWKTKVATLPAAPMLPLEKKRGYRPEARGSGKKSSNDPVKSYRLEARLSEAGLKTLRNSLRGKGVTLAAFLLACYAETLGHWSEEPAFTINVPWGNRLPVHADVNACVGEFASMTLVKYDCMASGSLLERTRLVMAQLLEDLQYCHVSGVAILREWRQANALGPEACMPFVFTSETDSGEGASSSWMEPLERIGRIRKGLSQTPQVWIDAQYAVVRGELRLSWDILDGVFPRGLAENMFAAFEALVRACADRDDIWHEAFPLSVLALPVPYSLTWGGDCAIADMDVAAVIDEFSSTRAEHVCIEDVRGALMWRDVSALVCGASARMCEAGLKPGEGVAILLEKGRWQSIMPFAVRSAGGVCIPLDVESPVERLEEIVRRCGAAMVVTDASLREKAAAFGLPMLDVASGELVRTALPTGRRVWDKSVFCVIHTSGSTGVPKGVELPFAGILNVRAHMGRLGLGADDVVLSLSPLQHDMSIPEYMGNMLCGMCAVYPDPRLRKDPRHWFELIEKHGVTFWHTVPAMLTMLVDYCRGLSEEKVKSVLASLRVVCLGGDWTPLETARTLFRLAPGAKIVTVGGPTEITIWNVTHTVTRVEDCWNSLPYGTPIANCGCRVVDAAGNIRPRGVVGEMCCTGPFMSPGYSNDDRLTQQLFPTCGKNGERLFKTGDMVRMHADGVLEFVGRKDNRVKIGGYRIELSEVEHHLQTFPAVEEAVVLARPGPAGSPVMVAWVRAREGKDICLKELRAHLLRFLPSYMIPPFIGLCSSFPVTSNGKVDRKAILEWQLPRTGEDVRLDTPLRSTLAKIWEELLGRRPESETSNFFECGGDSISAIRLLNKLMSAGFPHLGILSVFQHPSFAALAGYIAGLGAGEERNKLPSLSEAAQLQSASGLYPASRAQQRIHVDEMIQPVNGLYNLPFMFSLRGRIDTDRIIAAFGTAINANPALRTVFEERPDAAGGMLLVQRVLPRIEAPFEVLDLRNLSPESAAGRWTDAARKRGAEALTMLEGPLVRGTLALMPVEEGEAQAAELLLVVHHAVFDGWSMKIFLAQWRLAMEGTEVPMAKYSYGDFACWERLPEVMDAMQKHTDAYAAALRSLDAQPASFHASLAGARPQARGGGGSHSFFRHTLPHALAEQVRRAAAQEKVTPFIFLLAGFALLASRYSGSERILLGTYSAQRFLPDLESIVGMLVNPQPLAFDFAGAQTFEDILEAAHKGLMLAKQHELAPFELLVRSDDSSMESAGKTFFSITFSQDNTDKNLVRAGDVTLSIAAGGEHKSGMDMEVALHEADGGLSFVVVFDEAVMERGHVENLFARLEYVVAQCARQPDMALSEMRYCLDRDEVLLESVNCQAAVPLRHASLWDWFVETARRHPYQVAIMEYAGRDRREYSYLELFSRAVGMAETMKNLVPALSAETPLEHPRLIALYMPRGAELAAAMLAAWRLGAAVMPISVTLPAERALSILEHASPVALVANCPQDLAGLWGRCLERAFTGPVVLGSDIAQGNAGTAVLAAERPAGMLERTAWVIFTSGSTGRPKGVALSHAGLVGRLEWGEKLMPPTVQDKGCSKTDMAFGDCFCEIFGPLFYGFPVFFMEEKSIAHVDTLYEILKTEKITRLVAVPSLLREFAAMAERGKGTPDALRHIVSSGEPLPSVLAHRLQRAFPAAKIYNFYGSTEITCDAAWHLCSSSLTGTSAVPAGKPIAGGRILLMDKTRAVLPPGMRGEICVCGRMVCQGYLQENGSITKTDVFFRHKEEPAFGTGDMGVWTEDGNLICLGRTDRQIKIRGQKIAPQEVEGLLLALPGVQQASVLCMDDNGHDSLVACLAADRGNMSRVEKMPVLELLPAVLRSQLEGRLPAAFIPRYVLWMEDMPRIHTGKIDHAALRSMCKEEMTRLAERSREQPSEFDSEVAKALSGWWSDVLHVQPESDSNFFSDGGNSLLAVRLVHFMEKEFGVSMQVRQIYSLICFSGMVTYIEEQQRGSVGEWEEI